MVEPETRVEHMPCVTTPGSLAHGKGNAMKTEKVEIHCDCGNVFVAHVLPTAKVTECLICGEVSQIPGREAAEENTVESETYTLEQPTDQPVLASEKSDSPKVERPCPECLQLMASEAVICVHCGWDSRSGERHRTRVAPDVDGEEIDVFVGFGSGSPPKKGQRMNFFGQALVRFRADRLWIKGWVLGDPKIAAILAVPVAFVGALLTIGFDGKLGSLIGFCFIYTLWFFIIRNMMRKEEAYNSDGHVHSAYLDTKRCLLILGLENGQWACCRVPRKHRTMVRQALSGIYGDRLTCTRLRKYTSLEAIVVCIIVGVPFALMAGVLLSVLGVI